MCLSEKDLRRFDILNLDISSRERAKLRNRKWGFGETLTDYHIHIEDVQTAWKNFIKLYDETLIVWAKLDDIIQYTKRIRTGSTSLRSWYRIDNHQLSGIEKWNFLKKSMECWGWDVYQPACIAVRQSKSTPIVINGHHRIGVSIELKIESIPISFLYR
jgi:hypothetical protein